MTPKHLPLPNNAVVQTSLYLFNIASSFFPFSPGFNYRDYSNLTSTIIKSGYIWMLRRVALWTQSPRLTTYIAADFLSDLVAQ